jgi:hypothetical protein
MSWTTNDLRNVLKKYEDLYELEKDPFKKEMLLDYISNLKYSIAIEELTLYERMNIKDSDDEKETDNDQELDLDNCTCFGELTHNMYDITKFRCYYPYVEEFKNKLSLLLKYKDYKFNCESTLKLSHDEMLDIVHEVFKNSTKEIFDIVTNLEKEKNRIKFDETMDAYDGSSFAFPIVGERFIVVGVDGNTENTLDTLFHEIGHYIGSIFNEFRQGDKDVYVEIESMFFQLVGLDYASKELNNEYLRNIMIETLYDYYNASRHVITFRDINEDTFEHMNKVSNPYAYYSSLINSTSNYKNIDFPEKTKYLMGYICAVELFEVYKQDKELAIDLLKRIIKEDEKITEYHRITDNLNINNNIDKHVKRLKLGLGD